MIAANKQDPLVPSGWPILYSISFGCSTSDVVRGIKGEGKVREGGTMCPVDTWNLHSVVSVQSDCLGSERTVTS